MNHALITARLLESARVVSLASIALTVFSRDPIVMALGIVALYYALRVEFDARIFRDIADGKLTLEEFDAAMPHRKSGRPLEDRCRGARRLVTILGVITVMQLATLLVRSFLKS